MLGWLLPGRGNQREKNRETISMLDSTALRKTQRVVAMSSRSLVSGLSRVTYAVTRRNRQVGRVGAAAEADESDT